MSAVGATRQAVPPPAVPPTAAGSRRPRLVHVITGLEVGGAELTVERMVPALQRRGWSIAIVSLTSLGVVGARMREAGIEVHTLGLDPRRPDPRRLRALRRLLRALEPDVVQTWLYHADVIGSVATLGAQVPICWNLRQSETFAGSPLLTRTLPRIAARLSRRLPASIVANSRAGAGFHIDMGYDAARIRVIPNGVDTQRFRPDGSARHALRDELGLPDDAVLIGFCARFDPTKDHASLLAAFAGLAEDGDEVHLVLAGPGCERTNLGLAEAIDAAGRPARIHLLGTRDDLPRVLAGLDLYAQSSRTEGTPNALAEAMACGVPCVATDVGDTAVLAGGHVALVPPGDPDALRRELGALLRRPTAERSALGAAARAQVEASFAHEAAVDEYDVLYRELLETASDRVP